MSEIDWAKIKESVSVPHAELVDLIAKNHANGGDNAVRAVDKALRQEIAKLESEFTALKGGDR